MLVVLLIVLAYIVGSIPFAKIICERVGVDITKVGSGNIGFANVLRNVGWKCAVPTLIGDTSKGFLPVLLAAALSLNEAEQFVIGLGAIAGHIFSFFLKFKGGKGVATGFGVLLWIAPLAAMAGFIAYMVIIYLKKESSKGSIIALVLTAAIGILEDPSTWWMYVVLAMIVLYTLRSNINEWFIVHE